MFVLKLEKRQDGRNPGVPSITRIRQSPKDSQSEAWQARQRDSCATHCYVCDMPTMNNVACSMYVLCQLGQGRTKFSV